MDALLIVFGLLLMLVGLAGCILPFLPGPPLCYLALLIQQFADKKPFTVNFLITWGVITVALTVLDYLVPLYGTKKMGGSRYGLWGCTLGLIGGIWFGPLGILLGPLIGAFVGELLANRTSHQALKAALGSFLGFVLGTLLKLTVCLMMAYYLVMHVW